LPFSLSLRQLPQDSRIRRGAFVPCTAGWPVEIRGGLEGATGEKSPRAAASEKEFRAQARPQPSQGDRRLSDLPLGLSARTAYRANSRRGRTMGGCEGRLSVVTAVADMKDEAWGWRLGIGTDQKFSAPCLGLHVRSVRRDRGGCPFANGSSSVAGPASDARDQNTLPYTRVLRKLPQAKRKLLTIKMISIQT
jgi:hypothetical protein